MTLLFVIIGLTVLLFGRKLFWLFVGLIGFVAGFNYAPELIEVSSELTLFIIALITGLIGAGLAVFLQAVAIAVGGFFAGGYIAITLAELFIDFANTGEFWVIFIIGGIIGIIFLFAIFDYALIIISSLAGVAIILDVTSFSSTASLIIFIFLFILGVLVQTSMLNKQRDPNH